MAIDTFDEGDTVIITEGININTLGRVMTVYPRQTKVEGALYRVKLKDSGIRYYNASILRKVGD